jgi:glycosyltransferase involved in cell wall biosynthesis
MSSADRRPSDGRLRVAFLSFDFREVAVATANGLSRDAEVCLLLPEEDVAVVGADVLPQVELVAFAKPRLRQPLRQVRACRALLRRIREFDPDVVHLQQGHLWFNLALPLLRRYPLVLTIHDHTLHPGDRDSQKNSQAVNNFAFRRADQVIMHAERLKQEAVAVRGLPEETIHVIPLVAVGDRVPAPTTTEEDEHCVLFFGRIWPYKGLEYLIRAEPLISQRIPELRMVIAGAGENLARYRRLMTHPERFEVHNAFVSDEKRAELFARAAVVTLPYIEASQSAVVPVAYSFAKPVVATTVGGLPEAVEDGKTGLLVPPRDERRLAEAVIKLLEDEALRKSLGAAGKRKLDRESSPEAVAERTLAVYERAMEGSLR